MKIPRSQTCRLEACWEVLKKKRKKKSDEEKVTGILGLHLQGARAVVEKRSEIIDAIATETSLDEGPTKGRSAILSISLHLVSFSKDNPTVATFLFAQ